MVLATRCRIRGPCHPTAVASVIANRILLELLEFILFRQLGESFALNYKNIIFIKMGEWLDNDSASFTIEEPWSR